MMNKRYVTTFILTIIVVTMFILIVTVVMQNYQSVRGKFNKSLPIAENNSERNYETYEVDTSSYTKTEIITGKITLLNGSDSIITFNVPYEMYEILNIDDVIKFSTNFVESTAIIKTKGDTFINDNVEFTAVFDSSIYTFLNNEPVSVIISVKTYDSVFKIPSKYVKFENDEFFVYIYNDSIQAPISTRVDILGSKDDYTFILKGIHKGELVCDV